MNVLKIYINKLLDTDLDMITPVLTLLSPLTCVLGILKNKANVAQPSQCCFLSSSLATYSTFEAC